MGRTQLQDAVPMTLGQEFDGLRRDAGRRGPGARGDPARALRGQHGRHGDRHRPQRAGRLRARSARSTWRAITGLPIHLAENLIEATQDTQAFVLYSSCMKSLAIKLSKVCNDLRLLSSGPRCGLREINLPAKQPGSSIMPGKVNPVIPEVVNMVCFRVIGSDLTVSMAAEGGQLQLNVFEPVIAACIFEAQTMFINAARTLRVHCVDGITANADVCRHYVDYSIGTVTALNPVIGYDASTELAAEAMKTGRGIMELVREKKILTEQQIAEVLDPAAMTGPGTSGMTTAAQPPDRRGADRDAGAGGWRCGSAPPPDGLTAAGLAAVRALRRGDRLGGRRRVADPDRVGARAGGRRPHRHCCRPTQAYAGFANGTILLIVVAFLVARAVVKCGLGARIGHWRGQPCSAGRRSGCPTASSCVDAVIAPAFPSNTARSGVLYPLALSLAEAAGATPDDPDRRRLGALPDVLGHGEPQRCRRRCG